MRIKSQIQLSLIGFVLITVVFLVFVIRPLFSEIKESSQELISQKQTLSTFEAKVKNLEEFRDIYEEIEPNLQKVASFFVNPELPLGFINFLEASAQEFQLSIKIASYSLGESEEDHWPFLVLNITSVGAFSNLMNFLEKLEASPYLLEINNLSINKLTEIDIRREEFEGFTVEDVRAALSIKVYTK
jgi:Tfp pilus assembly protein PilO